MNSPNIDLSVVRALEEVADVILKYPYSPPTTRDLAVKLRERAKAIIEAPMREHDEAATTAKGL
jgi:hypothetical protein